MAQCDMLNAYKSSTCKASMAGTGDKAYFFDMDEWKSKIEGAFPTPGKMGFYGVNGEGAVDATAVAALNKLTGLLYGVDIKNESGEVTSEKGADADANSQKATFVVKDNIEAWNELAHTLQFKNWGCIIPRVGGGYYMVFSPYKSCKFENNFTSGTTWDSDHGFTVNIDASPAEYGVTFLPDGTANCANITCDITKGTGSTGATVTVTAPTSGGGE